MISPAEAEAIIQACVPLLPVEDCPLDAATGRTLRAPLLADRDLPPYDRVTMDGYAVRCGAEPPAPAAEAPSRSWKVVGVQAAGMVPQVLGSKTEAIEIATGAILPTGADAVIPYEETQRDGARFTLLAGARVASGQNIHRRASDHRAGDLLVAEGARLGAREIAVAAACGKPNLRVAVQPRIAIVATGDELAEVEAETIAPHHVRRSNDYALRAGLIAAGYSRVVRLHFRDVQHEITEGLRKLLLESDLILVTGGVSKGKFDFLPRALGELGVAAKFHGVAQRPGKPLWFGISNRNTPVFALPGNPVSTYLCFTRYVLPALARMSGRSAVAPEYAVLQSPVDFKPALTLFLPARLEADPSGRRLAQPMATNTSGDFAGLIGTDGCLELPPAPNGFAAGHVARFLPWP